MAALVAAASLPAAALIVDDPGNARPLLSPPLGAIGTWGNNAAAVAIGPNHVLTTRHQAGNGTTSTPALANVVLDGVTYNSVSQTLFDPAGETWDVRLVRIQQTNGSPANLTNFLPVYTPSVGESFVGRRVVFAAPGVTGLNETAQGFDWAPFDGGTPANSYGLTVGENVVDATSIQNSNGFNGTPRFDGDFDGPATAGAMTYESTIGPGDSGGAMLLFQQDQWWLIGLPNSVEQSNGGSLPEAFFGQDWFATDVTGLTSQIETAIGGGFSFPDPKPLPEPGTFALLGAAAMVGLRRRR